MFYNINNEKIFKKLKECKWKKLIVTHEKLFGGLVNFPAMKVKEKQSLCFALTKQLQIAVYQNGQ